MALKKCIQCDEMKDTWFDFTSTKEDTPIELDICKSCRLKNLVGERLLK